METYNIDIQISDLVSENDLTGALLLLREKQKLNPFTYLSIVLIERKLSDVNNSRRDGLISREQSNLEYACIAKNILELAQGYTSKKRFMLPILLLVIVLIFVSSLLSNYRTYVEKTNCKDRIEVHASGINAEIENIKDDCDDLMQVPNLPAPIQKKIKQLKKNSEDIQEELNKLVESKKKALMQGKLISSDEITIQIHRLPETYNISKIELLPVPKIENPIKILNAKDSAEVIEPLIRELEENLDRLKGHLQACVLLRNKDNLLETDTLFRNKYSGSIQLRFVIDSIHNAEKYWIFDSAKIETFDSSLKTERK